MMLNLIIMQHRTAVSAGLTDPRLDVSDVKNTLTLLMSAYKTAQFIEIYSKPLRYLFVYRCQIEGWISGLSSRIIGYHSSRQSMKNKPPARTSRPHCKETRRYQKISKLPTAPVTQTF